jgi:ArsR family transcriptional regulator
MRDESVLLRQMDLIQIYQCLCDPTRLRILHLLTQTPLCVCHFQEILGKPQVKISKHLASLRERGMVVSAREQNWRIYSLPRKRDVELEKNLKCLQDCVQADPVFKRDLKALAKLRSTCCDAPRGALIKAGKRRRELGARGRMVLA